VDAEGKGRVGAASLNQKVNMFRFEFGPQDSSRCVGLDSRQIS
jgi:hypothetical protein